MKLRPADGLLVLAVVVLGMSAAALLSRGGDTVMYDSFRDMAWARTILAGGEVLADPTLSGETYWYPPGNPLLFAGVAAVSGTDVGRVYSSSSVWWNGLIPVALFLLVRRASDRITALVSLPMVFLGSLWWMTHAASAMPSVQGVLLTLLSLLLWQRCVGTGHAVSWSWAGACGAAVGATAWVHPVCAVMAAAAIGLHAVAVVVRPAWIEEPSGGAHEVRRRFAAALLVVGGLSCALAAPLMIHLLTLGRHNTVPMRYTAPELFNPDFAVHLHAPLVLPLAVIGASFVVRRLGTQLWLVAYLAVGWLGSAPAYLERMTGTALPKLLPHEFQWHAQLAAGVCAAIGAVAAGRWLAGRLPWPREQAFARLLWIGGLTTAAISPALPYMQVADSYLVDLRAIELTRGDLAAWLIEHTGPDDVIACTEHHGYMVVAGLTGRRCVALPVGFMNPAADRETRAADLEAILTTENEEQLLEVAGRRAAGHLLVIVDSREAAGLLERALAWHSLTPVFRSSSSRAMVFRVARDTDLRFE